MPGFFNLKHVSKENWGRAGNVSVTWFKVSQAGGEVLRCLCLLIAP